MIQPDEDIDISYLDAKPRITKQQYLDAYEIYIETLCPGSPFNKRVLRNEDNVYTGLPNEVRFGNKEFPNMKMKIVFGKAYVHDHFYVWCDEISEESIGLIKKIEQTWKDAGIPIKEEV